MSLKKPEIEIWFYIFNIWDYIPNFIKINEISKIVTFVKLPT